MSSCARARELLARRARGLDDVERLELEDHLEACSACVEEDRVLGALRTTLGGGFELGHRARARRFDRAFSEAMSPERRAESARLERWAERRQFLRWASFGAAPALAAAAALLLLAPSPVRVRMARLPQLPAERSVWLPRVLSGDVETHDRAVHAGESLGDARRIAAETRASVRIGRARIELEPGSAVDWSRGFDALAVESGRVHFDVEHRDDRTYSVATTRFRVEVVGTSFSVDPSGVSVESGRVRVFEDGKPAAHELSAGQRFELTPELAEEKKPAAVDAPVIDVKALLASARSELARGNPAAARNAVERALAGRPTGAEAAEARSLLAECALVGGDRSEAQRRYAEVAAEHAGTSAGENAAFAAARLEKDPKRARRLLEGYLARYPKGRFVAEVEARLKSLR